MAEMVVDGPALIRWIRTVTGYSQEDLAALIGLPKSGGRTMISYWETGAREPNERQWESLLQIKPYLSVDAAYGKTSPSNFLRVRKPAEMNQP